MLRRQPTYSIAHETFVLPHYMDYGPGLLLNVSAMLIRGKEPVLVDTGSPDARESTLEALWELVEPEDLKWIFVTHDDHDHVGNLRAIMKAAPNATAVLSWNLVAKMLPIEFDVPTSRMIWVADEQTFHVGDRTLLALRPPAFDSPATRGLFDPTTRTYFAGDCFGSPMPRPVQFADELEPAYFRMGFHMFNLTNHPWVAWLEQSKLDKLIARVDALGAEVVASGHGPTVRGQTRQILEMMRESPTIQPSPSPTQAHLDLLKQHDLPAEYGLLLHVGQRQASQKKS